MGEVRWRAFRAVPWVWAGWERLYLFLHPLSPVAPGSLFAYRRRGNVLELHLDGRALQRMREGGGYSAFRTVHRLREDLAALAARIRAGEICGVALVRGTSLIGAAGAVLGFETRPLPRTLGGALAQYFMVGLDAVYHPKGLRARAAKRWPVETTMTVDALLSRYR